MLQGPRSCPCVLRNTALRAGSARGWVRTFSRWYYLAGIIGGVLILVAERLSRRAEPSGADVRRAAERYRQWYGDRALSVIGDHMLGARFAPDSRHTQFLKRVVDKVNSQIEGGERIGEVSAVVLSSDAAGTGQRRPCAWSPRTNSPNHLIASKAKYGVDGARSPPSEDRIRLLRKLLEMLRKSTG